MRLEVRSRRQRGASLVRWPSRGGAPKDPTRSSGCCKVRNGPLRPYLARGEDPRVVLSPSNQDLRGQFVRSSGWNFPGRLSVFTTRRGRYEGLFHQHADEKLASARRARDRGRLPDCANCSFGSAQCSRTARRAISTERDLRREQTRRRRLFGAEAQLSPSPSRIRERLQRFVRDCSGHPIVVA